MIQSCNCCCLFVFGYDLFGLLAPFILQRNHSKKKLLNYKLEVETLVQRSKELLGVIATPFI